MSQSPPYPPKGWRIPTREEARERRKMRFYWIRRAILHETQEGAAERLEIGIRSWRDYERLGSEPSSETIEKLVQITGLPWEWITGEIADEEED